MITHFRTLLPGLIAAAAALSLHAQQPDPGVPVPPAEPEPALPQQPVAPAPAPAPAPAANTAGVTAMLSRSEAAVGDQIFYSIRIPNAQNVDLNPRDLMVEGLSIFYGGTNQSMVQQGVGVVPMFEYRWRITANEPGEYTIPAQSFKVNGQQVDVAALQLKVTEAAPLPEDQQPVVQLLPSATELWKGELARVKVRMFIPETMDIVGMTTAQIPSKGIVVERFDPRGMYGTGQLNDRLMRSLEMESIFAATESGQVKMGPADVKTDMAFSGGIRDIYGSMPSQRRTLKLKSNEVTLTVKELPAEGRPDVKGQIPVGTFTLQVAPDRLDVALGEPLAVEIDVTGEGNLDLVQPPEMEKPDAWRRYNARLVEQPRNRFEEPSSRWGLDGGTRHWTQVIIAEKEVTELPPFVLHYFDPKTAKYVTVRTEPVALRITGDMRSPAQKGGALDGAQDYGKRVEPPPPDAALRDVLPHPLTAALITGATARPRITPATVHICGAAVLGIVLLGGVGRRMQAAAAARAARLAQPRDPAAILRDMRRSGIGRRELYTLATEYAEAWTFHRIRPLPEGHEGLDQVFTSRDAALYAGAPADEPASAEEQRFVTATLAGL